ncbi:uncharacterized protein [Dendrobates tinctorius]|uniref:uncharacterized protein n=1 Tax=Dendrobates tinctorius TaxID=92724 RepID=UPI003CCA6291
MYVLMIFIIFTCSMSSESEYSPSRQELAQADRETSSSSSADGNSEGEQQEQRSQVPVVIRNVPQRDEDVYLDNEQLISLVQERSPLWDSRDRLYKDNVVTRRLWNEVAAALMDGWDSATASAKKAFSEYFPALYCAAVTVVLDGTVGFRARRILAGNPTVSSWSTVTALSIVLLHCAAVTVVLDGTVGFRARRIRAGNPTVSSGSTVTALSIVLLHCAAVTVVLDGTVGFRARRILAGNPTVSSGSTVTALKHFIKCPGTGAAGAGQQRESQGSVGRRRVPQREEDYIDNDLLISLVEERVALCDSRHQEHSDMVVLRQQWNEVAKELMDDWDNATPRARKDFPP